MTDRPRVRDYMATDLVTLDPVMEINRAMHVLLDKRLSGAPVVDKTGWLIGILSKKDCLKAALQASYWRSYDSRGRNPSRRDGYRYCCRSVSGQQIPPLSGHAGRQAGRTGQPRRHPARAKRSMEPNERLDFWNDRVIELLYLPTGSQQSSWM